MLKLQRQLLKAKSFSSSNLLKHTAPNTTVSSSLRKFSQNILARQVNIETVKQLRKETDAPLGQIRKALEESNGDVEAAKEWLRKKGVQTAQKKSSREAANGLVALRISEDKKLGIAVEVNSETDFVAMNEKFKAMVSTVANALINHYNKSSTKSTAQVDVNEAKEVKAQENRSIQQVITDLVGSIGENIVLRRIAILKAGENEQICQYVHNDNGDSAGSIGTLVSVSFKGDEYDAEDMDELGRQVAMHVTGATPQFYSMEQIPKETIEKEKEDIKKGILQELETVTDEKKKQKSLQHVDKMVEGKLNKHLSQNILLEQPWAMGDGKTSVKTHLAEHNMQVNGFLRYKCGAADVSFYSDKI